VLCQARPVDLFLEQTNMKKFAVIFAMALALSGGTAFAQETVLQKTVEVKDAPGFWRKALNFATLGVMQATADSVKANQPFALAWDHDGIDTDSYAVLANTQQVASVPVSALANGTAQYSFTSGLAKGSYTFTVKAMGPGGEGLSSPLSLSVTAGNPSNPRNPRIIK
jgi:hypothetical protein